jgi:hypothetical protein
MQPDGEQQERHPDLRQELYLVHVPDGGTQGVRPDEDARGDVAEDQGQPEPAGHDASEEGGHQDEGDVTSYSHSLPTLLRSP